MPRARGKTDSVYKAVRQRSESRAKMTKSKGSQNGMSAQELRQLLDNNPVEEAVHEFFRDTVFRIGQGNRRFSGSSIVGVVSKFPVTPDRIPDFTSAFLNTTESQSASRLSFVELKKPASPLYAGHGRMSKDLNDAWMECVETIRLLADNFRDFLRRLVKALDETRLHEFDAGYAELSETECGETAYLRHFLRDSRMPWCNSVIVIGRRAALDAEGLLRTRELSASTGRAIRVITYDAVLDWLSEAAVHDTGEPWSIPAWYW
jgi:hypothetical protein